MNFLLFNNTLQSLELRFSCIIILVQPEMAKHLTTTIFFFPEEINFLKRTQTRVGGVRI